MALMTKRLSALLCHTHVCAGLRRLAAQGHKFLPSRRLTPRLRLLRAVVDADDNPLRRITFERDNLTPSNEILPTERLHCRRYQPNTSVRGLEIMLRSRRIPVRRGRDFASFPVVHDGPEREVL